MWILFTLAFILLSLTITIFGFFILKAKNGKALWQYITLAGMISAAICFSLNFIVIANYQSLTLAGTEIILNGRLTSNGFLYLITRSINGLIFGVFLGLIWWFALVKNKQTN